MAAHADDEGKRMTTIEVGLGARHYPIRIGTGLLGDAQGWRDALRGGHALIVSDGNVAPLYERRLRDALAQATGTPIHCEVLVLPAGEAHKNLDAVSKVLDALARLGATRDACVLAFGRRVVGDHPGFRAASLKPRIDFMQFPTPLPGKVDSSVGGKTGV